MLIWEGLIGLGLSKPPYIQIWVSIYRKESDSFWVILTLSDCEWLIMNLLYWEEWCMSQDESLLPFALLWLPLSFQEILGPHVTLHESVNHFSLSHSLCFSLFVLFLIALKLPAASHNTVVGFRRVADNFISYALHELWGSIPMQRELCVPCASLCMSLTEMIVSARQGVGVCKMFSATAIPLCGFARLQSCRLPSAWSYRLFGVGYAQSLGDFNNMALHFHPAQC